MSKTTYGILSTLFMVASFIAVFTLFNWKLLVVLILFGVSNYLGEKSNE